MKILLVNPYWTFYEGTNRRPGGPPTTIAVVAAALQKQGLITTKEFNPSDLNIIYDEWKNNKL